MTARVSKEEVSRSVGVWVCGLITMSGRISWSGDSF